MMQLYPGNFLSTRTTLFLSLLCIVLTSTSTIYSNGVLARLFSSLATWSSHMVARATAQSGWSNSFTTFLPKQPSFVLMNKLDQSTQLLSEQLSPQKSALVEKNLQHSNGSCSWLIPLTFGFDGELPEEKKGASRATPTKNPQGSLTKQADTMATHLLELMNISLNGTPAATLLAQPYEVQDQFLAYQMDLLMDPEDKYCFKVIAKAGQACNAVWKKHPGLRDLIARHAVKPDPSAFVNDLNKFKPQELPPIFYKAKQRVKRKLDNMPFFSKASLQLKVYYKFKATE